MGDDSLPIDGIPAITVSRKISSFPCVNTSTTKLGSPFLVRKIIGLFGLPGTICVDPRF